jgi:hypothetical protein
MRLRRHTHMLPARTFMSPRSAAGVARRTSSCNVIATLPPGSRRKDALGDTLQRSGLAVRTENSTAEANGLVSVTTPDTV